jgi:probable poly-beta-1,6-N-acetyl-D-glucosamine export protein
MDATVEAMDAGCLQVAGSEARSIPFLPYIHGFRAIAIVGVVASHLQLVWPNGSLLGRLLVSIAQDTSAMFLFVSGFLFQHLSQRFEYPRYLKSKLHNVIIPYAVSSLPALLYQGTRHTGIFDPTYPRHVANPFLHAALALATASHMPAPMWFIPMIAVLYLVAPLLIAVDRHPRLYWMVVPLLILAMFCHRPLPVNRIGHALVYFTPAYLLGMWFSHHREQVMRFVDAHLAALLLAWLGLELLCVVILKETGTVFSRLPFSTEQGILDLNLPGKMLLSFGLIGVLARYRHAVGRKLDYLAGASFGVFFIHQYIIDRVDILAVKSHYTIGGSLTNAFGLLLVYVLGSLGVVALVRAVAGKRSRFLIGC